MSKPNKMDHLDETMNAAMEAHVSYPKHKDALVVVNKLMAKSRRKETEDEFSKIFVSREEWKAERQKKDPEPMGTPISYIRFWAFTNTDACRKKEKCFWILREIQERHMSVGFGDIRFNFVIGGEGSVFEGRGWHAKPPPDPTYEYEGNNHLEIGFIGDLRIKSKIYDPYRRQLQLDSSYTLIEHGKKNGFITKEYTSSWKEK